MRLSHTLVLCLMLYWTCLALFDRQVNEKYFISPKRRLCMLLLKTAFCFRFLTIIVVNIPLLTTNIFLYRNTLPTVRLTRKTQKRHLQFITWIKPRRRQRILSNILVANSYTKSLWNLLQTDRILHELQKSFRHTQSNSSGTNSHRRLCN